MNFLDLFLPNTHIASATRGRAFLWLLFHYLEAEHPPNPFDDQYSLRHPGRVPYLRPLTSTEYSRENVDTAQEILWGNMMSGQRNLFLQKLVSTTDLDKRSKANTPHFVTGVSLSFIHFPSRLMIVAPPDMGNNPSRNQRLLQDSRRDERFLFYVPGQETQPPQPSEPRRKCSITTALFSLNSEGFLALQAHMDIDHQHPRDTNAPCSNVCPLPINVFKPLTSN